MEPPRGYFTNLIENNIVDELFDDSDDDKLSDNVPSDEESLDEELSGEFELSHTHRLTDEQNAEFLSNSMSFNTDKAWLEAYQVVDTNHESQFAKCGPPKANEDWKDLIFGNKKVLSRALEEWHVTHFVRMKVRKSARNQYTCVCVNSNCCWRLHVHKPKGANYFLVSRDCVIPIGHRMHRNCTSGLICEKILPSMRDSLSMSLKEIELKVKDDLKTYISYQLAWKARCKALRVIYGSWEQSFSDLPMYLSMMQIANPGTIWTMSPAWPRSGLQKFRRVFWAFGPSIEGWKHCRPLISVDGTHLYGKYEGHALITSSIDANDCLYPITFAICEKENGDNWEWLSHSLKEFVTHDRKVCIISDRFSGNKEVVRRVFSPNEGHAHCWCLRHIKANLKKACFIDKVLLGKFYAIGCASEVVDFNRLKEELKS